MQGLFNLLLRLTLSGGLFVLLLLAARAMTRNKFPARWRRLAAAISPLFFFVPFSVPLPAPVPAFIPAQQPTAMIEPAVPTPVEAVPFTPAGAASPWGMLLIIWACGAAVFTVYHGVGWTRFSRAVKSAAHPVDEETERFYQALAQEMGVRRPPRLIQCAGVGAPMAAGVFRPCLLLPEDTGTQEQLALILRHELTHYKSGDIPLKLAALLAANLHWFNPLAHVPGYLLEADCELACDERMALSMSPAQRKQYGMAILEQISLARAPLSAPFSRKRLLKGRLETILHAKDVSRLVRAACAGVMGSLLAVGVLAASLMAYALEPASNAAFLTLDGLRTIPHDALGETVWSAFLPDERAPAMTAETDESSGSHQEQFLTAAGTFPLSYPIPGAPVQDSFMSYYGHTGTDYAAPEGTPILAAADGTVVQVKYGADGYGNHIIIDHGDGHQTLYAHCADLLARMGESVERGQTIAVSGSTGNTAYPHCHFELRISGTPVDAVPAMEEPS